MKNFYSKLTIAVFHFLYCLINTLKAQNNKLGSWDILNLLVTPKDKWTIYFETQTRSQKLTTDFYYHEFKGGLQYNLPKKNAIFVGMGDYATYGFPGNFKSPVITREFRIWEQFILNNNIDRIKIEHRYRIEQRWVDKDFRSRFRYRINPVIPVNHLTVIPHTFYFTAFDELFFGNHAPYFERNRFFIGAGYQFSKMFALQGGFIRQYDYNKVNDGSGKNFIQTSLLFFLDKTLLNRERHPSTMD